jgi:hypothetical protein
MITYLRVINPYKYIDGNVCAYVVNIFYCIYIQYAYGIDELYFNLLLFFKVYASLVKEEKVFY